MTLDKKYAGIKCKYTFTDEHVAPDSIICTHPSGPKRCIQCNPLGVCPLASEKEQV